MSMSDTFAQPVAADPGQHVNPVQAAKELRKLMRLALDYMDSGAASFSTKWTYTWSHMKNTRETYLPTIEAQLGTIEVALKKRQTAPGLEAVQELQRSLAYTKESVDSVFLYADQEKNKTTSNLSFTETTSKQLQKTMARIHVLIQSLPTIAAAPSSLPENVLRTIGVVLENAGYVAKKSPDVLPKLNEDEVEDEPEEEDDDDD